MQTDGFIGLLAVLAAPFLASFMAVVVERYPLEEGTVAGRSRCASCARPLRAHELVPLISFLLQRGRCRGCGAAIPLWLPAMELAALLLTMQAMTVLGAGWQVWIAAILAVMLLGITTIDLRHFLIPDFLSLPLVLSGLSLALAAPDRWQSAFERSLGALAGYLLLAGIAAGYARLRGREGLGLGDAKLFAAAGAWTGWQGLPFVLLTASLAGLVGVLGLRLFGRRLGAADAVAFGPYLALGFWLVWLYGPP